MVTTSVKSEIFFLQISRKGEPWKSPFSTKKTNFRGFHEVKIWNSYILLAEITRANCFLIFILYFWRCIVESYITSILSTSSQNGVIFIDIVWNDEIAFFSSVNFVLLQQKSSLSNISLWCLIKFLFLFIWIYTLSINLSCAKDEKIIR